jgi:hypothetical protein
MTRFLTAAFCAAGLSFAALIFSLVTADAHQTAREQAWNECLKAVAKYRTDDPEAEAQRSAAFKACMAKKGFKP